MEYIEMKNETEHLLQYPVAYTKIEFLQKFAKTVVKFLNDRYSEVLYPEDCIHLAGRGTSGNVLMTMIAAHYNKDNLKLITVRKDNESSHASQVSNDVVRDNDVVIIVDDFISTGKTIIQMIDMMDKNDIPMSRIRGIILASGNKPKDERKACTHGKLPDSIDFISSMNL